jgi:hypothetical protein
LLLDHAGQESAVTDRDRPPSGFGARLAVVVAFVAAWMSIGWAFRLDPNLYLLAGVPLTAVFQLAIARRPLRALWVREAPPLRLDARGGLLAAGLAVLPFVGLTSSLHSGWVIVGWYLCAILGAAAAAYAIRHGDRRLLPAARPALLVFLYFSLLMAFIAWRRGPGAFRLAAVPEALRWTALYFPVCFLLEEVTFRGAIDAYLYRPGEPRRWWSAVAGSFLWGIWHLPIIPLDQLNVATPLIVGLWHMTVGVPLCLSRRIGGNLAVPAAAHAALDGVRNALSLLPGGS